MVHCVNGCICQSVCPWYARGMQVKPSEFAAMLKGRREELGLTQAQAALLIGSKNRRAWAAYEDGSVNPSIEKAEQLCKALGLVLELTPQRRKAPSGDAGG